MNSNNEIKKELWTYKDFFSRKNGYEECLNLKEIYSYLANRVKENIKDQKDGMKSVVSERK